MGIVICHLPDAGLGNQLFPLAKALVFSHINDMNLVVTGYHRIKPGPYLRREKNKRKYKAFFTFQRSVLGEMRDKLRIKRYLARYQVINDPGLSVVNEKEKKVFVFKSLSHYSDYFNELKDHRELAISLLFKVIKPEILIGLSKIKAPQIALHIRMGDFRKLKAGEDFNKVGSVRTPVNYFIDMINTIRTVAGKCLSVHVFTDGHPEELQELFALPGIHLVEGNNDITDLLLMSKSKVIITSAGSTFSYWAGYLSDAVVVMHPGHIHASVRPASINEKWYEGPLITENIHPLLSTNLKALSGLPTDSKLYL